MCEMYYFCPDCVTEVARLRNMLKRMEGLYDRLSEIENEIKERQLNKIHP